MGITYSDLITKIRGTNLCNQVELADIMIDLVMLVAVRQGLDPERLTENFNSLRNRAVNLNPYDGPALKQFMTDLVSQISDDAHPDDTITAPTTESPEQVEP